MVQLITDLNDYPESLHSGVLSIGNFDGVHRGHKRLIDELVAQAAERKVPAVVMTFDPPPQAVLVPSRKLPTPLTSIARRAELLGELGVDAVVAYPTDTALMSLSPRDFFDQIVIGRFHAGGMVEGPNFRFGRDRSGGVDLLAELCQSNKMSFSVVDAIADPTGMIPSTRIRGLLAKGDVMAANDLLTEPYEISGMVSSGSQRGRELGYPTANLMEIESFIPGHGVYSGSLELSGERYRAAINIGPTPTFDDDTAKVEVHIIGWTGELYGQKLNCRLEKRIRDVRRFESVEELRQQISQDIALSVE